MKFPRILPSAALLGAVSFSLICARQSSGQTTATTNPVGFTTLSAVGKANGSPGYSFLSLNMVRPTAYRATVPSGGSSVSNGQTVLSFPSGTFSNDQFDGTGNACYVEITSGGFAGMTANVVTTLASDPNYSGASTITLNMDISAAITAGTTTFLVRQHWTFGTAFGTPAASGLQGGSSASTADNIQIIDPTTGVGSNFYFSTATNKWTNFGADATNTIIPPNAGLYVLRKQASTASIVITGEVKLGQSALTVVGGSTPNNTNLIPNPYPLNSVTLANSNLYTGAITSGVVGGASAALADNVGVLDPTTGAINNYYYNTTRSRWESFGTDASNFTIPSGTSIFITRKSARPSFIWYVPQPAISL